MSKKKVKSAPRSCSARGRESRKAEAESSKSPFRANAPALLQRELRKRIREARESEVYWREGGIEAHAQRNLGRWLALVGIRNWLRTPDGKRALARNNKSSDLR